MKISYAEYIKKTDASVLVAEAIFSELETKYDLKPISEVAQTTSGGTPLRGTSDFYNGEIPWLKSGELNDGLIEKAEEYITEKGLANSSAKKHPKGTLLLAMYGATAGRTGITKIEAATNQAVCALFPNQLVTQEFLFWFLRQYRHKFIEISKGGAQPNISQGVINRTKLPVPPKELQIEISKLLFRVEKEKTITVEETPFRFREKVSKVLFAKNNVFAIDTELTHQLDLVKQLRQAFLREAMQGKLTHTSSAFSPPASGGVAEGRGGSTTSTPPGLPLAGEEKGGVESGSELLQKIKVEKQKLIKDGKLKKEKELPPIKPEEIPFDIPKNWVWCRLGEIAMNIEYGTSERAEMSADHVPVLRMNNIQDSKIDYSSLKYVRASIEDLPKLYLKNGDLLFNRTNSYELVGKSGVYHGKDNLMTFASYLIRVQFNKSIAVDFINSYINSSLCRTTQLEPDIIQQNGQANFNGTKLKNIICPLPPLSEQNLIVAKLEQLMRYCDELEQSIKQSQAQNEQLLQQVLREALSPKKYEINNEMSLAAEPN